MEEEQYFNGGNFDSEAVFIEDGEKEMHPLFRKEVFFLQSFIISNISSFGCYFI